MQAPTLQQAKARYTEIIAAARQSEGENGVLLATAELGRTDLFFLLRYILNRADVDNEWIFARCREVQREPDGRLDLWAREHYKSTIITVALTIQDILNDAETTVGIFSFNRPAAKGFLRQIKGEFENNALLKACYPEILWETPAKEAPKWSEDDGIIIKRLGNPKEATVEAHGLIEGLPTGKHFKLMVFDDVIAADSVTTPDMIAKVTAAWELSLALTTRGGRIRYIGTRYHHADTYRTIIEREAAIVRKHAATADGTEDGEPVLMTRELLAKKRREMGPFHFGAQMLLDPLADTVQGFKREWLQFLEPGASILTPIPRHSGYLNEDERAASKNPPLNRYLLVDPANAKTKKADFTVVLVVGLGVDGNYYILDMIRDRLNLGERADAVMRLHRRWHPLGVGYEEYGMQADIPHLEHVMAQKNYRFVITPLGGRIAKPDRIRQLVPICEEKRLWLPQSFMYRDYENKERDLVKEFVEDEFCAFPRCLHDDMLDCLARICDPELGAQWPKEETPPDRYLKRRRQQHLGTWMSL